jgi:hypothetical protein
LEALPFIKNLLIDSLAGISFRNLPFILLQLISAGIAAIIYLKISRYKSNRTSFLVFTIGFTALFIIAFTSVPLSIAAGFIILAFLLFKPDKPGNTIDVLTEQKIVLLLFSYAAGAGHLILLAMTLIVLAIFYFFYLKKK